jgi:hypothetical protein
MWNFYLSKMLSWDKCLVSRPVFLGTLKSFELGAAHSLDLPALLFSWLGWFVMTFRGGGHDLLRPGDSRQ